MSWGNPQTPREHATAKLLWPASVGLGVGTYCRMMAYNVGVMKQRKFPVPVVSIGNITVGGTGKTPITIDLAQRLIAEGHKVGILSRGYKRQSKERTVVVSDGKQLLSTCAEAGDEPYLMAQTLRRAVVIVGSKRVDSAQIAVEDYGCDVLLLDDGFQHFAIARDTDIVLTDYNDELENDHLLPAGRLREPLTALSRADWIVITKVPEKPDLNHLNRIRSLIARHNPTAIVSSCRMVSRSLSPFGCPDITLGPSTLKGTQVLQLSGIARPGAFKNQLESMGAVVVDEKSFGDHHWYSEKDIEQVRASMQASGAEMIITTEKDSVKINSAWLQDLPVAVLQQRVEWLGPIPLLDKAPHVMPHDRPSPAHIPESY